MNRGDISLKTNGDGDGLRIADITEFYSAMGGVRAYLNLKGQILQKLGHHHLVVAPGIRSKESTLWNGNNSRRPINGHGSAALAEIAGPKFPYDANYRLLCRIQKAQEAIERFRPEVVSVNSPYLATLVVRTLPQAPGRIRTMWWHSDFVDTYLRKIALKALPAGFADYLLHSVWKWVRWVLNGYSATFVASASQASLLRTRGIKQVYEIPFGIDKEIFHLSDRDEKMRLELLGGDSEASLLVAVGRLSIDKEWDVIIEGMRRMAARKPVQLVIFGDGPEKMRLVFRAQGLPIRFAGFESDRHALARTLSCADAFVHGCSHETFGLSVAEAIACGLPVVVPNRGGAYDLAKPDFAETYEAGNSEAFAAAVERLLLRHRLQLRLACEAASSALVSAEEHVARVVVAYQELLAEAQLAALRQKPPTKLIPIKSF